MIKKMDWQLILMLVPGVILVFIFAYIPMAGLVIAFQDFIPARGLFGNQKWIGFGNLTYVMTMPNAFLVLRNTLVIAVGKIILGMVVPIIIALLLNELRNKAFKRSIQTIIYFPYFLSWVVFGGLLIDILSPSNGIVNDILALVGIPRLFFLGDNRYFQMTMIATDVWKTFGFGTVIYLASITSIDLTLYEAAEIDGAGRWKQAQHITMPGLKMIIILLMVLNLGNILNAGFDQIFNLYNPIVYSTGDIIDTLVYRIGILDYQFGPATIVGLFKSGISFVLIAASYLFAYKAYDYRIF